MDSKELPPLRGLDNNKSGFTYNSIAKRLTTILNQMIAENTFDQDVLAQIEKMSKDVSAETATIEYFIRNDKDEKRKHEINVWTKWTEKFLGKTWLEAPWFFVEVYMYRRIMEITGWFEKQIDPFHKQKFNNLEQSLDTIREFCSTRLRHPHSVFCTAGQLDKTEFVGLLYGSLWGNRSDLSLSPEGIQKEDIVVHHGSSTEKINKILIDDADKIWDHIQAHAQDSTRTVIFIMDNAGFELVCDLFLADALIASKLATSVVFHLKAHPTFVSDSLVKDFHFTLDHLAQDSNSDVQAFAQRWKKCLADGLWLLEEDFYWNSPEPFWEGMPSRIKDQLASAVITFVKGDANYRRVHGDLHWPFTYSTSQLASYFPGSFVMLRTLKSEVITGLSEDTLKAVKDESGWLTTGKFGVVQLIKHS